jgi:signal transduction histidine kinase
MREDFDRLAHQMRNPVMVIRTLAKLMAKSLAEGDPNRSLLLVIDRECRRLDSLIDGDFADLVCTNVDLSVLISNLVPSFQVLAERQGIQFSTEFVDPLQVQADARALSEVLVNLLDNAFKYAESKVTLSVVSGNQTCQIAISDDGSGIAEAELAQIFDPYYRGSGADALPGQGLGLAIARDLVLAMGGTLVAENLSPGSRFVITLPLS